MSSTDEKNFKRYTAELKAAGLIDGRGHVLPDAIICRNLEYNDVQIKKFMDIKKARAAVMDRRAKARAKEAYENAKRKAEDEESSSKRTKSDSSEQANDKDSSSEPDIKLSATPPDDDDETTESCKFCGGEECKLCAHMRNDMNESLFLVRACAVYNHQMDAQFKSPILTLSKPSYCQMVEFARLGGQKVMVTEPEFDTVSYYKNCRYCGCLLSASSAVIKGKGPVTRDNLVPCCMLCSTIKVDVPEEEFLAQCKRIVEHSRKCPVPCKQPFLDGTQSCADHYYGFLPEK
jgi:hypothetical protein